MALSLLMAEYCQKHGVKLICLTVDHKLRATSTDEAQWLQQYMATMGIKCEVLTIGDDHTTPPITSSGIQNQARKHRYQLLTAYCQQWQITTLCTAHHRDDNDESFLLRAIRGSSIKGLRCIEATTKINGINILRPLLNVKKPQLVTYLQQRQIQWLEDPSNQTTKYDRNKWRQLINNNQALFTNNNMAETIANCQLAYRAIKFYVTQAWQQHIKISDYGYIYCSMKELLTHHPQEVTMRVIAHALYTVGEKSIIKGSKLKALHDKILPPQSAFTLTINGCYVTLKQGYLYCYREPSKIVMGDVELLAGQQLIWDNRFIITNPSNKTLLVTTKAKAEAKARAKARTKAGNWQKKQLKKQLPAIIRQTTPCVIDKQGYYDEDLYSLQSPKNNNIKLCEDFYSVNKTLL
jgi:tRNA(Ile)-lysidine synthase